MGFSGDVDGEGVAFLSEKEKTNSTDPAVAEGASLAITSQVSISHLSHSADGLPIRD